MLRIKDWKHHFEVAQSRRCPDVMKWVPIPNKQDGDGYTELLGHPQGTEHFGAWTAIVQLASKCKPRGTLVRDGDKPHDITSISRITRVPENILSAAIRRLIDPIGWLEDVSPSSLGVVSESTPPTGQDSTRQDSTLHSASADSSEPSQATDSEPAILVFRTVGKGLKQWSLTQAFVDELQEVYPNVDVLAECRKAALKIGNKAVTAKTAKGMPRFLMSWMDRTQNSSRGHGTTDDPRGNMAAVREYLDEVEHG